MLKSACYFLIIASLATEDRISDQVGFVLLASGPGRLCVADSHSRQISWIGTYQTFCSDFTVYELQIFYGIPLIAAKFYYSSHLATSFSSG